MLIYIFAIFAMDFIILNVSQQ